MKIQHENQGFVHVQVQLGAGTAKGLRTAPTPGRAQGPQGAELVTETQRGRRQSRGEAPRV